MRVHQTSNPILPPNAFPSIWHPTLYFPIPFPSTWQEAWYFVREGNEFVRKEETSEAMTLKGKRDVDPALREAITSKEDGIMPVGALPKMEGISSQGSKSLMEAMAKVAPAPKRKPKEQQSEPVEPLTTEGRAKALLQDMLKDAADARTQSIKLCDMEFADALSQELLEYAAKVEGYYKKLSQAVNEKDEEVLKGLLDRICGIMTGGAKAQAGGLETTHLPPSYMYE